MSAALSLPRLPVPSSVPSTTAKDQFGKLLERVAAGEIVRITRRGRRPAVVLSEELYESLVGALPDPLERLRGQFDAMVARVNSAKGRKAADTLFAADGDALGRAALKAARKR